MLSNAKIRSFWMLVDIAGPDDCWLWKGNVNPGTGYGRFRPAGATEKVGAHRLALILEGPPEPPPPANHALHGDCANPLCVNPRHLRWGTLQDNVDDYRRLEHAARGVPHNTMTPDLVRYVRNSAETGVAIAGRLGISKALVSLIRNRKIWVHVD